MIKPAARSALPKTPRQRWSQLEWGLTWAYCSPYPARFNGFRYEVDHISAWWIKKGWAELRTPQKELRAHAGEWLIGSTGRRFQLASADCVLLSIGFTCRWKFGRDLLPSGSLYRLSAAEEPDLCQPAQQLTNRVAKIFPGITTSLPGAEAELAAHLELESLFCNWLRFFIVALERHGARFQAFTLDPRVEQVLQAIGADPVPDPGALCRAAGLSRSRLDHLFTEELGETLRDTIDRRRWTLAQSLLTDPGTRMKEIAARLGFASQQHFSRWCKQHGKGTPSELRAMALGARNL